MNNTENGFLVYCADIGTELDEQQNFAWVCSEVEENEKYKDKNTLETLANSILDNIKKSKKIAIGFECPLYFDMQPNSRLVTKGRGYNEQQDTTKSKKGRGEIDGNRSWTGQTGATVLVTGLAQTTWLFQYLHNKLNGSLPKIFIMDSYSWDEFKKEKKGIFIWEAFVSNKKKKNTDEKKYKDPDEHKIDATMGVLAFLQEYKKKEPYNNCNENSIKGLKKILEKYLEKTDNIEAKRIKDFLKSIEGNSEYKDEAQKDNNNTDVPNFSIIGSVLLRTGWSKDEDILNKKCIVIKP